MNQKENFLEKYQASKMNLETPNFVQSFKEHIMLLSQQCDRLCERFSIDYLLIASGGFVHPFKDQTEYPFKVNHYFKQWVPLCDHPNCYLLAIPGHKPTLLYYRPDDIWSHWPDLPANDWMSYFNIVIIKQLDDVDRHIPKSKFKGCFVGDPSCLKDKWGIEQVNIEEVLAFINYHRIYKSAYEKRCLYQANVIAARGHNVAAELFQAGASELEVHLGYLGACRCLDSDMPYNTIVGFNEHAAILHYRHKQTTRNRQEKTAMLIDAGAQYNGYAADITRTYSYQSDEFAELITEFDDLQQRVVNEIKPGMHYLDLQDKTVQFICELLEKKQIINCSAEQCFEIGLSRKFYLHDLGHFLGLQVHDAGYYMADETGRRPPVDERYPRGLNHIIQDGMVFTIEPGLYFNDKMLSQLHASNESKWVNWDVVARYKPFGGIRIEDNIYVGKEGVENLTRLAFESLATKNEH